MNILPMIQGFAVLASSPGYEYIPPVTQGRAWRVVDSTGTQVGAIVEPAACGIAVLVAPPTTAQPNPTTVLVWSPAGLDQDANGWINGDDADLYALRSKWGVPAADFDCNGWVNGDDADGFAGAFQRGTP